MVFIICISTFMHFHALMNLHESAWKIYENFGGCNRLLGQVTNGNYLKALFVYSKSVKFIFIQYQYIIFTILIYLPWKKEQFLAWTNICNWREKG